MSMSERGASYALGLQLKDQLKYGFGQLRGCGHRAFALIGTEAEQGGNVTHLIQPRFVLHI